MRLTKEEFLALSSKLYEEMSSKMDSQTQDFYDYESTFDQLLTSFGQEVLEESISLVSDVERKKKVQTRYGKISVDSRHTYSECLHGFQISPYMQERMAYVGQSDVYSESNNLINKLLCIEINPMQVYRVTDKIGSLSENIIDASSISDLAVSDTDVVYAQADGAMVLTRENKWQEVKTGRIFKHSDILMLSTKRSELKKSIYVSNLGHYSGFLEKFEPLTDSLDKLGERLVFISDGVTWLRQWATESYPNATHILDIYHVYEHLKQGLNLFCKDEILRNTLYQKWKIVLLEQGAAFLIEQINTSFTNKNLTKTQQKAKEQLLNYLTINTFRMDYPEYRKRGLVIGSGAIEAAQRTVLQKRLKRAGQRWSEKGVDNMLNLRVAFLSDKWENVKNIIINKVAA
jgi:hypothetical protein